MTIKQRTYILALVVMGIAVLVIGGMLHNGLSAVADLAGALLFLTAIIGMVVSLRLAVRKPGAHRDEP